MNKAAPTVIADGEVTIDDQKYIVFKRNEFNEALNVGEIPAAIQDAVVIRRQDVFAASGLYAYASAISNGLDIAQEQLGDAMDPETVKHLRALADYFAVQADMSQHYHSRKVPD